MKAADAASLEHLPPGPFEYETTAPMERHHGMGHVYIVDATGKKVAVVWGKPDVKMALVKLIVEARDKVKEEPKE